MSETTDPRTKVAQNLTAIVTMSNRLPAQAINRANNREIPGGNALASLAPVASPQTYAWQLDYLERILGQHPDLTHDDDPWETPLQTLLYWSEQWRSLNGMELDGRQPTLATEANFLRWALDWAWEHEPRFQKFMEHVADARRRLENELTDGTRPDRLRVICDRDYCTTPGRLICVYAAREHVADECMSCGALYDPDERDQCTCDGMLQPAHNSNPDDDTWKCPSCKHIYTHDDVKRAHASQLRSEGAEKFVSLTDAIGTLKAQGRGERTIRRWLADGDVETRRHPNGQTEAWWPDMWRLHLGTPMRRRAS